ncbi:MAG: thiamine phosphate synthase [Acidipropionibacterium jensenii]|nr:thiamine phosphate synthase [Acidipropionibacterium jensenii]
MDLGVYLVTDPRMCADRGVSQTVAAAVAGGVRTVQIRDKSCSATDFLALVEEVVETVAGRAMVVVNDRLDVVRTARERGVRVDGVHLGQGDADPRVAREQLGPDAVIGLTADHAAHLAAVESWPAGTIDYLGVGVIHDTSTKLDHPPVLGIDGFARFTAASPVPTVAIGGISRDDLAGLRRAGASGAAVVSALFAAEGPPEAARDLVEAWQQAPVPAGSLARS